MEQNTTTDKGRYIQEVYFTDGTVEKTKFKDYSDWYYHHNTTKGVMSGPTAYDGEGGAYQTTALVDGTEGVALFDGNGVVSYNKGTIGGVNTSLIFDYTHLPLWRKLYADDPDRLKRYDEIEKEYTEKIAQKRLGVPHPENSKYEKLFDEFMEMVEFTLIKHPDNMWSVNDRQGADLGGINGERYKNAPEIFDRMDNYVYDYFVVDLEECLEKAGFKIPDWVGYDELIEYARPLLPDNQWDCDVLNMVYSHAYEIDLNRCFYEKAEEFFGGYYSMKDFHDYSDDAEM